MTRTGPARSTSWFEADGQIPREWAGQWAEAVLGILRLGVRAGAGPS
ncbi:hypothetical protein [Streptomyces brevispora]